MGLSKYKNESMQLLSYRMRGRRNNIRFGRNESLEHKIAKCAVCIMLVEKGYEFYTEAYFTNGLRADVYVLDLRVAIEIAKSEEEKSIMKKFRDYPCDIEVVRI